MTGCLSETSTTVSYNDRNNNGYPNPPGGLPGGGGGGSLTGTFIQPSPLGDLKKTPFEAGQATVKISWRRNTKRFLLLNYSTIFRSWCKNGAVLKLEHEEGKFWIRGPFLECPGSYWARKAVAVRIQDGSLNSFADNVMKLSFKKTNGPVCRQGLMPSLVRFWLKRLISKQANGPLQHCFVIFPS